MTTAIPSPASPLPENFHNEETDDYYYVDEDYDENDWEPIVVDDPDIDDYNSYSSDESDELSSIASEPADDEALSSPFKTIRRWSLTQPTKTARTANLYFLILSIPLLLALLLSSYPFSTADFGDGLDTLYLPGLGFSGFWFTLGRLKSIPDKASKHYVCFSAGCLGSVAILNDFSVQEMGCMAVTAQQRWKRGEINRFEVVSQFVDGLVYRDFEGCSIGSDKKKKSQKRKKIPINNPQLLSKLHILTTVPSSSALLGVESVMRSPASLEELREMLIQTAWIPVATGDSWTHQGHMDGGFSFWQHPRCTQSVNLPLEPGLIFNSLNVNMPIEKAYELWNQGLAYGL